MKFVSKHRKLRVQYNNKIIKFKEFGAGSAYETEDEKEIKFLKAHKDYGNKGFGAFVANGKIEPTPSNVVQGARGGNRDDLREMFKKYDELRQAIVKVDGLYRKDATKEQIIEFEEVKKELGL